MRNGKLNIYVGLAVMVVAAAAGIALGRTLEPFYASGYGQITFWRLLTRAGHTHGMLFGLFNVVAGLLIARMRCSEWLRRAISLAVVLSVLLPVGVSLRGLTHGACVAELLAMFGGLSLMVGCVLAMIGVARTPDLDQT